MRSTVASRLGRGKVLLASGVLAFGATAFAAGPKPAPPGPPGPGGIAVPAKPPNIAPYLQDLPFAAPPITVPRIPPRTFDIEQYGAERNALTASAVTANTAAINDAIAAANAAGGGEVVIPSGIWVTGSIVMKSDVNLHVDRGAVVEFSANHSAFPLISQFGQKTYQAPIYAVGLENIAITGHGIFNGNGNTWNRVPEYKLSSEQWNTLVASGGVVQGQTWYPSAQLAADQNLIPFMTFILNSKNVLIDGPTFENSPSEAMYINFTNNVVVAHARVQNPWYSENTVGIDVSADRDVLLYKDTINTGDDAIALNSSPGSSPDTLQDVIIEDSTIQNAHGGIAVGSYTSGGMKDVYVHNVSMTGTEDGIRFKSAVGRGGLVQDFWFSDIHMRNIQDYAITFNADYNNQSPAQGSLASLKAVPQFENIFIDDLVCDYAGQAIRIAGLSYAPVENVLLRNVTFKAARQYTIADAEHVSLQNVSYLHGNELGLVPHYGVAGP